MRRVSAKFVPRLLTDDQKEHRVEISQELLANAYDNENFLKNTITGDETQVYVYNVETKLQSSQWMGKGSLRQKTKNKKIKNKQKQKKTKDESVKDQRIVGCVFWLERHCPSWICTIWLVVPGSFSAFEGCCAQEEAWIVGKQDTDVAPRQCAGSRVTPHPQLSGKTSDIRCAPSTLFSGLSPSRLFPVSQTENHFEKMSLPNHRGDSGKCDKWTARHHRKCVPGSIPTTEEMLGTVYRQ